MLLPLIPGLLATMAVDNELVQIKPMSHGNIFTVVGHIYTGSRSGHIVIPFNLKTLRERRDQLDAINQHIQSLNENKIHPSNDPKKKKLVLNGKNRRAIAWMKFWINQTVSENIIRIDDTLYSFTKNGTRLDETNRRRRESPLASEFFPVIRNKRQLVMGTIGVALGATIAGIVSKYQEDKLLHIIEKKQQVIVTQLEENAVKIAQTSEDMLRLNKTVGKVIRAMYNLESHVNTTNFVTMTLTTTFAVTETVQKINHLLAALEDSRSGQFNTDLCNSIYLKDALMDLGRQGLADGRTLGVRSMLDLNHLEVSYLIDFSKELVYTITHVPLVRASDYLTLYEYVGSPIQVKKEKEVYAEINVSGYLAIAKDNSQYQEWTEESLKKCQKFGKVYYCPDNVRYMRARTSCLTALYDGNSKIAHQLCPMNLVNQISTAVQLNESSYLITETQRQSLVVLCGNKKRKYPIQGTITLRMARACVASTSNLVIQHPAMEAEVTVDSRMITTPLDFTEMIEEAETEDFLKTAEEMISHVGQKIPVNMVRSIAKLRKGLVIAGQFESIGTWLLSWKPGSFSSIVIGLAITVAMVFVIYKLTPCCLKMVKHQLCQRRNENPPQALDDPYQEVRENQINHRRRNPPSPNLPESQMEAGEGEGTVLIHAPTSSHENERAVRYRRPTTKSSLEKTNQNPIFVVNSQGERIHPTPSLLAVIHDDSGVDQSIKEAWIQALPEVPMDIPTSYICSPPPVPSSEDSGIERKEFQDIIDANRNRKLYKHTKAYKEAGLLAWNSRKCGPETLDFRGLRAAVALEYHLDEPTLDTLMEKFLKENIDMVGTGRLTEADCGTFASEELASIKTYPFKRASKHVKPQTGSGEADLKQVKSFLKKCGKEREAYLALASFEQDATLKRFEEEVFKILVFKENQVFMKKPGAFTAVTMETKK